MKSVVSTVAVLFFALTFAACSKKEAAPAPVVETPAAAPAAPAETAKQEEKK